MKLAGWGRYPVIEAKVSSPRDEAELRAHLVAAPQAIARGNGRAYGDSAVAPAATLHMRNFNRMLAFDPTTGQLVAEAGVILGDVIRTFLPQGWFPAVTPGTKFVTLGGAIAADVHGKNHHKDGSFGTSVDWIDVMGADGTVTRAHPGDDLFAWTLGGMGLSGVILRAAIRLAPVETGWIRQTTKALPNLRAVMAAFEGAHDPQYSVAWIDCLVGGDALGRSLLMLGDHATPWELGHRQDRDRFAMAPKGTRRVPFDFPGWALNGTSVGLFNALYYAKGRRNEGIKLVDWDSYFYPLDALLGWNRIYGRRGFAQFQCALPLDRSEAGLTKLLRCIGRAGAGSFLAVLKRFGPQTSAFSFPMEGYTLALDFPMGPRTLPLLERLDQITLDHGGRFYLAKDSRMSADTLRAADPRAARFTEHRREAGWAARFCSAQSERLHL